MRGQACALVDPLLHMSVCASTYPDHVIKAVETIYFNTNRIWIHPLVLSPSVFAQVKRHLNVGAAHLPVLVQPVRHKAGDGSLCPAFVGVNVREHLFQPPCADGMVIYPAVVDFTLQPMVAANGRSYHVLAQPKCSVKNGICNCTLKLYIALHVPVIHCQHAVFADDEHAVIHVGIAEIIVRINRCRV